MIIINNFEIQNNGQNLALNVQTETGFNITSVLLWNMNNFKDYTRAINLDYKLEQTSNIESFVVTAEELSISKFEDLWFVEIQSNNQNLSSGPFNSIFNFVFNSENTNITTLEPALGITYNFSPYYICILEQFLNSQKNPCINCKDSIIDDLVLTSSLMVDIVEKAIEEGYYLQAISILTKLKKICNIRKCNNCETVECSSCSKFKQN